MKTAFRASTGIDGLDEVLHGGYVVGHSHLLSGPPGTGKTTLGWHFLSAGRAAGEPGMLITFGEPAAALRTNAALTGINPDSIEVLDLSPPPEFFAENKTYDLFTAAEVEREPTTEAILQAVDRVAPRRVFIDSITHLRYLARDDQEYRRHSLAFLRYLLDRGITVLLSSEATANTPDDDLRFLCDAVIEFSADARSRWLLVTKFRGAGYRPGKHSLTLDERGATVFPRLIPGEHAQPFEPIPLPSGVAALDALLHGGLERGTVTLLTGPSGVGKTTLGVQFMKEAATRGHRSAVYTFDERTDILLSRCDAVSIPVKGMLDEGMLSVLEVEALSLGADQFADLVRRDVEEKGTQIVMIDSISGYRLAVSGDQLTERLHALCKYLQNVGVTVLLVNEVQDLTDFRVSEAGVSYLADNVLFMRFIERKVDGRIELQRAIGVLKKRLSDFEKTLRPFRITSAGIKIGEPLQRLVGALGGLTSGVELD